MVLVGNSWALRQILLNQVTIIFNSDFITFYKGFLADFQQITLVQSPPSKSLNVYPDNSPNRTIPHCTGIGPDEWFYWFVVVLVGSSPSGE